MYKALPTKCQQNKHNIYYLDSEFVVRLAFWPAKAYKARCPICFTRLLLRPPPASCCCFPLQAPVASGWLHSSTRLFSLTEILLGHAVPHRTHKHVCHRHKKPKHNIFPIHTHTALVRRKSICFDCAWSTRSLQYFINTSIPSAVFYVDHRAKMQMKVRFEIFKKINFWLKLAKKRKL